MTAKGVDGGEPYLTRTGDGPRPAGEVDLTRVEGPGAREEAALADSTPPLLGRYSLLRKLGEGGMGIVWSAFDEELDRKVAIKLMRVRGSNESTAASRMLHEARAMAMLSHPNVVHVYDVRVVGGQVFLAMEFVAGPTLREWLGGADEAARPWPEALAMYLQAGLGLAAAHRAGLVHRDFKPDNVLVGNDGRVRVVDFGLAARSDGAGGEVRLTAEENEARATELSRSGSVRQMRSDPQLTPFGTLLGTPAYMSPEQHLRQPADPRSDQYSFCVSVYEGLYGERPFAGATSGDIRVNVLAGRLRDPPPGRKVPAWLRKVVVRGLCVAPEDRYPSMEALLAALAADPGRVRRRRLAGLGAVVLAGAAFASQGLRPEVCRGDERALAGVWDGERAQAVEQALRATGLAYARGTWPRVQEQLDMYAGTWRDVRRETCEATNVHRTQSAALMDVRMACLDQRRADLRAVVGVLAEADAQVAERAVQLVAGLPSPAECTEATGEGEEGDAEAVQAVREALSQVRAEEQSGRWVRGRELAESAVAAADATGVDKVRAEALLHRGRMEGAAGDYATAEATLVAAYTLAETAGHATVKGEAATRLVRVVGDHRGRDGEALLWGRLAEAVLAGLRDPRLAVELRQNLGIVHSRFGRYDEALTALQGAIDLDRAGDRVATYHRLVGAVQYRRGRYAEALAEWEQAITLGEAALGPDHPDLAKAITNLGEALRKQGQGLRAREAFRRAINIWEGAFGRESALLAAPLNGLGTMALLDGDYATAVAAFDRVRGLVERSSGPAHPDVGAVMANLGEALLRKGDAAASRLHSNKALAILEKALGPEHDALADVLSNLARADVLEDRFSEAEATYARAVRIVESAQGAQFPELAKPLTGQGLLELARGRPAAAVAPLERALALRGDQGRDPAELAELRLALARALWDSGSDRPRAHALATTARAALASVVATPPQAARLRELEAWLAEHPQPT